MGHELQKDEEQDLQRLSKKKVSFINYRFWK